MTKRFKLKISRILSFKSCRSKHPSSLPFNPVPSISRRPSPPVNPSADDTTVSKRTSSFKLHVLTAFGCGSGRRRSSTPVDVNPRNSPSSSPPQTPSFQWESEGKWHVIAQLKEGEYESPRRKICNSGTEKIDRRHLVKKEKNSRRRERTFAAEEIEEETETERESLLPSSTNLSPEDSSSELPRVTKRRRNPPPKKKTEKRKSLSSGVEEESESSSPARLSSFVQRFMPCTAAAAVMVEGVAVVKRSEDPYQDFKGSMMEMIVEKNMFEVAELEQLLRCFLTLNAKRHHRAIVKAFSEVWVALFSASRRSSFSTVRLSDYDEC